MRVLGAILAQRRATSALSQLELASNVGASQSLISRIERGTAPLDAFLARKIAQMLGLTMDTLHHLVDTALARTATVVLDVCAEQAHRESWWTDAERVGGHDGLNALIRFTVAAVLMESPAPEVGSRY